MVMMMITAALIHDVLVRSKRDGTRAETRFGLSAKQTSPFKSAGVSVQSAAGSRGVRISGQRLYRPCSDVQCKAAGYPLHSHLSPSLPLPCVTVCHQMPSALYVGNQWNIWLQTKGVNPQLKFAVTSHFMIRSQTASSCSSSVFQAFLIFSSTVHSNIPPFR